MYLPSLQPLSCRTVAILEPLRLPTDSPGQVRSEQSSSVLPSYETAPGNLSFMNVA